MKKMMFIAAAAIAVTVSACTKESSVTPAKVKTNLAAGKRDTISNGAHALIAPKDTISNK